MTGKRMLAVVLLILAVVACAVASWAAGSAIQSPAEAAARTAPPTPSPILVPVEERVLSADVVTRGTARFGDPQSLILAPSPLKPDASIITSLPERGTRIEEGDVALTVSGRPVFVLKGAVPAYRDLAAGLSGRDVLQLEQALKRLGFDPGAVDGIYDTDTTTAVTNWYRSAGWPAFTTTAEQATRLRALEQALLDAQNAQRTAASAVETTALAEAAARAEAQAATSAAQADVQASQAERDQLPPGSGRAVAESRLLAAEAALAAARAAGEMHIQAAAAARDAAERTAVSATAQVAQATAVLDTARTTAGAKVPLDELLFVPQLPVRVDAHAANIGDPARGPVLTVTDNQLAVDAVLPLEEAPLVHPGMPVRIDEPDLGVRASGVVVFVADTPGTHGADGYHVYLEITVTETTSSLEGFSLRLTIPVQSTDGAVTAVPISALSLAPDGTTRVQVLGDTGLETIVVEPGLSADGFVEVRPVEGTLSADQLVVIGFETRP